MTDRLLQTVKHWLLVLFAAALSLGLLQQGAPPSSDPGSQLIALALLCFVAWHLGKPAWRIWKWWRRRRPQRQHPELPTPAQWIVPREQRRRNREVR
jgi:hypothetical protein